MTYLPDNWILEKIGRLCELSNGRAFKPNDWVVTGLPIVRIQNLNNPTTRFNYYDKEVDERFLLRGGELLFAWSGTPGTSFGAHVWYGKKAVLNQHIFRVDFDESLIDKHFFRYAINQKLEELINIAHGGVGLRHVTKGVFKNTQIVVPPFSEQKCIADKLDALLARVDACRDHLERVPGILKRFRQAVLSAAVSGQLTEEWREKNGLDEPMHVTLNETKSNTSYGSSAKSQKAGTVPVLRMGNIQDGKLDWTDLVYTSDNKEIAKYQLITGDVLFNRTNSPELVGKTAVYKGDKPAIYAGYLIKVKCGPNLLPDYLNYCLNSPYGREWCWQVKSDGVSQSNINAQKLGEFQFLLPSLKEQEEIARRVEVLFSFVDNLESRCHAAKKLVDNLTPALLAKAFRGELVPQDPEDEPASVLLERIHAERSAREAGGKKAAKIGKTSLE